MTTNTEKALNEYLVRVQEAMVNQLFENNSVNSGELGRSIKVIPVQDVEGGIEGGIKMDWYGQLLENGGPARKAGGFPPPQAIKAFMRRKGITPRSGMSVDTVAYLIGRKIAQNGATYPKKPFIKRSFELVKQQWGDEAITDAAGLDITEAINVAFMSTGAQIT
jgi:hypothetical protein